jgi:hypothetical protein
LLAGSAFAAEKDNCVAVGGSFLTNVGGFGDNTTLGVITGDLKGAVGVQILGESAGPNGTTIISVQHHLVTETGDTVFIDNAQAIGVFVAPGLFALTNYQIHLSGGTGKFKGASGDMSAIGEADFNSGQLIGRYTGQICYAK